MVNWFNELNNVDVKDHIKQKNGLNYLSWMWAWSELKKRYPLSRATVHETPDGMLVWRDPIGCHVKTSVTIVWEEDGAEHEHTVTEYLPCMDHRNKTVAYEDVDAMLVNKTVQRSLTKCIARLGLGGYIFAGEDLPEELVKATALQDEIMSIITKKCSLSDKAREEVGGICKAAEKEANPDLEDEAVRGDPKNIDDVTILEKLKKRLLGVRK